MTKANVEMERIESGRYRVRSKDGIAFYLSLTSQTRRIPRLRKTIEVPVWKVTGNGVRRTGFKDRRDALAWFMAEEWGKPHRRTPSEIVGRQRRPTSFVLVERGLFDAADGMPYVPNVEAKKGSA